MSVMVLLEMSMAEGRLDEAALWLKTVVMDARAHPGCILLDAYQAKADPGTFVFVEQFETRADHEAYVVWRWEHGGLGHLAGLLAGSPRVRYFDLVDV